MSNTPNPSAGSNQPERNCRLPLELYYDPPNHVWVRPETSADAEQEGSLAAAGLYTLGITDVGQTLARELLFCQPKPVGTVLALGKATAVIESGKSIWPVRCPVPGEIADTNPAAEASPTLINADPYGAGWIVKIRAEGGAQGLATALKALTTGEEMLAAYRLLMEDLGFGQCIPYPPKS